MSTVRFSHYCLEDGDEYFGDVIAELRSFRIISSSTSFNENNNSIANPSFAATSSSSATTSGTFSSNNNSFFPTSPPGGSVMTNQQQQPVTSPSSTSVFTVKDATGTTPSHHQSFLQMTNRHYVELLPGGGNKKKTKIEFIPTVFRGKLRFGSKGLFFDADDVSVPVMGFKSQTILNSWEQVRNNNNNNNNNTSSSSSLWSTPVLSLSSASFLSQEEATELSTSSNSQYLNQTIILPFSGIVTGQRRFGLPHPHILDSTSFSAPNTFLCFILPFASTTQSFNDYLNRSNMLLLARHSSVEVMKRNMKLLMIQKARESTAGFKFSYLEDPDGEDILRETCCHRIQPLIRERGRAVISSINIYFQPTFPIAASAKSEAANLTKIPLKTVTQVERRWFDCSETALEIFFEEELQQQNNNNNNTSSSSSSSSRISSIFLHFESVEDREVFSSSLRKHPIVKPVLRAASVPFVQELWHQGKITNFDYLMFLNSFAGRSKQDLSQYPVFPWVISNYTVSIFDFDDPSNYRDLSKPIGALEPKRLEMFKQRAQDLKEMEQEPFLYGTHYSNSAYVIYFLLRSAPQLMLVLQSGRWDKPQRLFDSVPDVWKSVLENPADVKELIPEFFENNSDNNNNLGGGGDFLDLKQTLSGRSAAVGALSDTELETLFDFGKKDDGEPVRFAVQLPPWANDDVFTFIKINKMALESDIVSASIHHWIDLIFGYKQKGTEAWKANNVFHPSCYEDQDHNNSSSSSSSPEDLEQLRAHRQMFGQVPRQIFTQPHPLRRSLERKLYKRAASKAESIDEMDQDNHQQQQEEEQEVKPLASLREALLQLSQQDLNDILTSPSRPSHQQQSFGSKPSSSASPSFASPASNNNSSADLGKEMLNDHKKQHNIGNSDEGNKRMEEVTARAVELAERLERQIITESKNTSFAGESVLNNKNNKEKKDETPVVENSADLFANFTTTAPKDMMNTVGTPRSSNEEGGDGKGQNQEKEVVNNNDNADEDDDDQSAKAMTSYTSSPSESSPTLLQCLPRICPGTTLPEEVMAKFGDGNIGFTAVATTSSSSSASGSSSKICLIIMLSNDGTEIGVLPVSSRGFEELKVSSLPEKCISAVTWESSNNSCWTILVSHTGNILVFSPINCKVYARIPDSGEDSDVITCVSFWKSGSLLFCGRDNGSMACWSILENRSSTFAEDDSSSSTSASTSPTANPPMVSKTSLQINFETGRALVGACRDASSISSTNNNSNNNNHQLIFTSDDGETLFAKHKASTPFVAAAMAPKNFVKPFAGMTHEIDMKTVLCVWPIHASRALQVCKVEEIAEEFSEEEVLEENSVVVLGVLTNDGKIHLIGARDDSDESDMMEMLAVLDLQQQSHSTTSNNNNNTNNNNYTSPSSSTNKFSAATTVSNAVVVDYSLLSAPHQTVKSKNENSCRHFVSVLMNGGRCISLVDSDSGKAVLGNILANAPSSSSYSVIATCWPFIVALDAQNGQVCVWELLMF